MDNIIEFYNVSAGYRRTMILKGLSFTVEKGETLGIIGPNGCGKTTMLNALTGIIKISSGSVLFKGKDISSLTPDRRCRLGIGRTFQVPRPFTGLSIFENVQAAGIFGAGLSSEEAGEEAMKILKDVGLTETADSLPGKLTLLDRKRLEIARALAVRPSLLLLDEVAAGLTTPEVSEIMDLAARLKTSGFTIIWIEHILETMLHSTDRLICMAEGRVAVEGLPYEVIHSEEVEELYLGIRKET